MLYGLENSGRLLKSFAEKLCTDEERKKLLNQTVEK